MTLKPVYLDHAGASLPSPEQMQDVADALKLSIGRPYGNPHSSHLSGQTTSDMIDAIRHKILQYFNTDSSEYSIIFTANATASLKLVAESFNFRRKSSPSVFRYLQNVDPSIFIESESTLLMLQDSHTSVVGMRQVAACQQVIVAKNFDQLHQSVDEFIAQKVSTSINNDTEQQQVNNLFVFTAMSNFCGRKYDLSIVQKLRDAFGDCWRVCLDAAALVGGAPLNLSECRPDFVVLSFYKMFGYPTGVGALIVRNSAAACLNRRRYFGGGTVDFASPFADVAKMRADLTRRFEDGTPDYYSISALRHGFNDLERYGIIFQYCIYLTKISQMFSGGIYTIAENTVRFTVEAFTFLRTVKHANGAPIATIYGHGWNHKEGTFSEELVRRQGAILNFNLLRDDGSFVGFIEVEKMADLFGIELRTGCFCNQGACALHLSLNEEVLANAFGDIETFKAMISTCFSTKRFIGTTVSSAADYRASNVRFATLTHIFVYPVKSCASIEAKSWLLSATLGGGLRYDRAWMIASARDGTPLTQKRYPALCTIQPEIDEARKKLILKDSYNVLSNHTVDISSDSYQNGEQIAAKICSDSVSALCDIGGPATSAWLTRLDASLGEDSRLVGFQSECSLSKSERQNFSNQSDFLLVTRPSLVRLSEVTGLDYDSVLRRFRPNFVIDFYGDGSDMVSPFEEDDFEELYIGSAHFKVVGRCTRCQMICIDQHTGEKDPNILVALRDMRRPIAAAVQESLNDGKRVIGADHSRQQANEEPEITRTEVWSHVTVGCNVHITRRRAMN